MTTYNAISPFLLGIAASCEPFMGKLILRHFLEMDLLQPRTDRETWIANTNALAEANPTIPDWIKQLLPTALQSINFEQIETQSIASFVQLLSSAHPELLEALQELENEK